MLAGLQIFPRLLLGEPEGVLTISETLPDEIAGHWGQVTLAPIIGEFNKVIKVEKFLVKVYQLISEE